MACHNKVRDGVADLVEKAFTPTHVRNDPLIFAGRAVQRTNAHPDGYTHLPTKHNTEATEHKGKLLIREIFHNGTGSVHGMYIVNTDAKSHLAKTPEKCLQEEERTKKKMYLEACLHQCWNLLPLVDSVDGIMGVEAGSIMKRLAIRLATKWRQPYSRTCGYVKSRIAITLV